VEFVVLLVGTNVLVKVAAVDVVVGVVRRVDIAGLKE
jgi:hypothetical protein